MNPFNDNFYVYKNELKNLVENNNETHYPPYNAWIEDNGDCIVEIAVAGFSKEDLEIKLRNNTLFVTGEKDDQKDEAIGKRKWIKRGLAKRKFVRKFEVVGAFLINKAILKNGILTIILKNEDKTSTVIIQDE